MTHAATSAASHGRPMDEAQLVAWVARAAPGQHLTYWQGFLARDTWSLGSSLGEGDRRRLARLARLALRFAEEGWLHLLQQRLAPYRYRYIAIARFPEHGPALLRPVASRATSASLPPAADPIPHSPSANRSIA